MTSDNFLHHLFNYQRRISSVVEIGDIPMGGTYPIRIQSMTNTLTLDTKSTVEQCKALFDSGADYVRITTPAIRDAENLADIKRDLRKAGYSKPLIADVHFNPAVAEAAARIVEKVRINPGNYADKKKFEQVEFTDIEYNNELERINLRIRPLLNICKEYGTAIRIGVNHGSLSDRIMSRYGDTPEGMVESAMEFLRIMQSEGFLKTVISMKSSNTRVMVYSTRLLIKKMEEEGMNYPVHLGVTEAGEGEDGIIKSAVGIGALLADGIGETIRVSLTGDPLQEIPVAKAITEYFGSLVNHPLIVANNPFLFNPYDFQRRSTIEKYQIGGFQVPKVVTTLSPETDIKDIPIHEEDSFFISGESTSKYPFCETDGSNSVIPDNETGLWVVNSGHPFMTGEVRSVISRLQSQNNKQPLILRRKYDELNLSQLQIKAACDFGSLLIDGFTDAIWIENANPVISAHDLYHLSLNLLQASRLRSTKTEYISCPSCGRTLFDLTKATALIRERTSHLKHLKIGIMGCIVNGPGEMADADYGYVGAGPGKITLYKNKQIVKRNIPEDEAVEELIAIIRSNGDWIDP
jgi:(E)-4-hydroxy-3-methylbut-2-enyl-diphosphate synthase